MTTEHDEADETEWPAEVDPIRSAACPLVMCILELTAPGSRERARAMSEMLEAVERIRHALRPRPQLH